MSDILKNIKNLREISGAGFLDCKKALEENSNDIEKSIFFLRKKGLSKSAKKESRTANEGAVGIFTNDSRTLVLEINTETDFAAKNSLFLDFFEMIGNFGLSLTDIKNDDLESFLDSKLENKAVLELFNEIISKIGEKIALRRFRFFEHSKNLIPFSYVHNQYKNNIGKICSLLIAEVGNSNLDDNLKIFGKNLCMHIAASKPISLDIKSLDNDLIEKERDIQFASIKSSGKPEKIINSILEGKMKKFYSDVTLYNQPYILDTNKNVKDVINDFSSKNGKFHIQDYLIYVLGN